MRPVESWPFGHAKAVLAKAMRFWHQLTILNGDTEVPKEFVVAFRVIELVTTAAAMRDPALLGPPQSLIEWV